MATWMIIMSIALGALFYCSYVFWIVGAIVVFVIGNIYYVAKLTYEEDDMSVRSNCACMILLSPLFSVLWPVAIVGYYVPIWVNKLLKITLEAQKNDNIIG
jgi:hypothetical protein